MAVEATKGIGQTIGNYDLLDKIADGGMGSVYRGRNRNSGQIVAIKIVPPHLASNGVLLKRFEQEFLAASKLDHPNIVHGLDFGKDGDFPYLVMEFVDGPSLGQKIEKDGRLPELEAKRIVGQIAQALYKAHKQGMIHRDVKPDNILLGPDGTAKLADLGLVKDEMTDLNLTRTGRGLGTPHFMAPEQFKNAKNATVKCDIYSLGATLYMMVTGELPFRSCGPLDAFMKKLNGDIPPPRQIVPTLSERIEWAIQRAMSPNPDDRPATCREFVEDITGRTTRRVQQSGVIPITDVWYLVYRDEDGVVHTVKGSQFAIRKSLKDGLLGDASNISASRDKTGPFAPLRDYPEFRDLVISVNAPGSAKIPVNEAPKPRAAPPAAAPTPARAATQTPRSPTSPRAPHIDLTRSGRRQATQGISLGTVFLLAAVALGTAVVSTLLILFFR